MGFQGRGRSRIPRITRSLSSGRPTGSGLWPARWQAPAGPGGSIRATALAQGGNMLNRKPLAFALITALAMMTASAVAHHESKYPDWGGQWKRPPAIRSQWDPPKPFGLAQ